MTAALGWTPDLEVRDAAPAFAPRRFVVGLAPVARRRFDGSTQHSWASGPCCGDAILAQFRSLRLSAVSLIAAATRVRCRGTGSLGTMHFERDGRCARSSPTTWRPAEA